MTTFHVLLILIAAHVVYALFVLVRVARFDGYSRPQKLSQSLLAVLFPLFGTLLVDMMLRAAAAKPRKKDERFDPDYIGR
jgi:hypothetical protein